MAVIKSLRSLPIIHVARAYTKPDCSRQDAKNTKFGKFNFFAAFAPLREILRVLVAGVAALCASWCHHATFF
jgi:hypothetical protein